MDYKTSLEEKVNLLVGRSLAKVRYNFQTCYDWDEFGPGVTRVGEDLHLDVSKAIPSSVSLVPQELVLRFATGRWAVISAARYHGEGNGFRGWMDEVLVVHDDALMRRHEMGPHAAPPLEAPP